MDGGGFKEARTAKVTIEFIIQGTELPCPKSVLTVDKLL